METNNLKELITSYYTLYKKLERVGGPTVDGDLFEEVLGLEEEIMEKYGLPPSHQHTSILWELTNQDELTEEQLQQTIGQLQAAAQRYHSAPVLTDLEQLQKAKDQDRSTFDILPELGQPTHDYPIFLYEVMLQYVSPEEILKEFSVLKRLNCYGDTAILKNRYPRTFRRTKIYKQLKPYLQFLDMYLDYDPDKPFLVAIATEEVREEPMLDDLFSTENIRNIQSDLSSLPRPDEVEFTPRYKVLTDFITIEEIIFSRDSAVTVNGLLNKSYKPYPISLGFDFDMLMEVIMAYPEQATNILNYFNKSRQQEASDEPVIVNLKDKTYRNLELTKHYFKVYQPLQLGPKGKLIPMQEHFYIVEKIVDKARFDQKRREHLKSQLGGSFHHMLNHYYYYLNALRDGKSKAEARKFSGLEDSVRFEVSKLLYLLYKHGGRTEMK